MSTNGDDEEMREFARALFTTDDDDDKASRDFLAALFATPTEGEK